MGSIRIWGQAMPLEGGHSLGVTATPTQAAEFFGMLVVVATENDGDGQHVPDAVDMAGRSFMESRERVRVDVVDSLTKRPTVGFTY